MDASTIISMIKERQIGDSNEIAPFLEHDTDLYLLLMGMELHCSEESDMIKVVAGYAAVHDQEALNKFIYNLTDLSVLNTLNSLAKTESYIGQFTKGVYEPGVEGSFLKKGRAFIAHNGMVGVDDAGKLFGTLEQKMLGIGFWQSHANNTLTIAEFESFYKTLQQTKYFVYSGDTDEYRYMRDDKEKEKKMLVNCRVVIPATEFKHLYAHEKADVRKKIDNCCGVEVRFEALYNKTKKCLEFEETIDIDFKRGSRYATRKMVEEAYKDKFLKEGMKRMYVNLEQKKTMVIKTVQVLKAEKDFMALVLREGKKLLEKTEGKPNAMVLRKPSETACVETHFDTAEIPTGDEIPEASAEAQPATAEESSRGMCPECGKERTCDMDEIEHGLHACGQCGLEVPRSLIDQDWELDPVTREYKLKEV